MGWPLFYQKKIYRNIKINVKPADLISIQAILIADRFSVISIFLPPPNLMSPVYFFAAL